MNLFKKKNIGEHMFSNKESREQKIKRLFCDAAARRSAVEEYWQKMRAYYDGTHETARKTGDFLSSVNIPWRPAQIPDAYMHVESQVASKMPDFEFAPRTQADAKAAKTREKLVRYVCDINDMERKNAENERRLNIFGSAVWKLCVCADERGMPEIALDNPAPSSIYPDPNAGSVNDCEFIGYSYRMSKAKAERVFAADLARMGTSLDGLILEAKRDKKARECFDMDIYEEDNPTVSVLEWWFRQDSDGEFLRADGTACTYARGDIALCVLIGGKEVRYVPKFWTNTPCSRYPFVIYGRIPSDESIWGKSELEQIIPLIDAADRQMAFAQLNAAFFANDILVYEENAFAPDSFPDNRPGAVWKLRPGMMEKVSRLGGLSQNSESHYEIVDKYRRMIKETLGNYDYMQGDYSTNVTTATGLALLSDLATERMSAKNVCKKAGFYELYRLMDIFALEFYTAEKAGLITGESTEDIFAMGAYVPELDVRVNIGEGVENSRSFTVSALGELMQASVNAENYPMVRAYISAVDIPAKADIIAELDKKFATNMGE
ncbi:MAG: hypothetical protein E7608_05015 [Ruminococcaceae bacterium]|nr:hypothetical protein [Oscillospiraceae bacterium]